MTNTPQNSYLDLPDNLPIPQDDGAADHLDGIKLNPVLLTATNGELIAGSVDALVDAALYQHVGL